MLRDDHYPSFNVVKWQSSDLIGSLKSRLAITKMTRILPLVTRLSLPRGEKRGGARDYILCYEGMHVLPETFVTVDAIEKWVCKN